MVVTSDAIWSVSIFIYIYIYMLGVGSCQQSVSSMRTLSLPKLVLHVAVFCGLDTAHVNP